MRAFPAVMAVLAIGCKADAAPSSSAASGAPGSASAASGSSGSSRSGDHCEPLPFATTIPVAEASGAAILPQGLIVVGDSGNRGEYVIIDPDTGDTRERGHLPLPDGISDDIEGISSPDGRTVYGLVSDGTLLHWTRTADDKAFALDATSRIGDARDKNYEGLCLSPASVAPHDHAAHDAHAGDHASAACDGYAASKADGHLYCLRAGRIDAKAPALAIARKDQLADCAFSLDGKTLVAAGNVFAADMVWTVDRATGATAAVGPLGPGNGEVVVLAAGGIVYRFSDLNRAPSLAGKFRCPALAR